MSEFWHMLVSNPLLNLCVVAWFSAQFIKTTLDFTVHRRLNLERMLGAGGMPSSHSSLVCALVVGVARTEGYRSTLFAMSLVLAGIVMYDAMGVRRAAGEQAKAINRIVFDFDDLSDLIREALATNNISQLFSEERLGRYAGSAATQLKEYLGHTPVEVFSGAMLGILLGFFYPLTNTF